jgi:hypothetical protein
MDMVGKAKKPKARHNIDRNVPIKDAPQQKKMTGGKRGGEVFKVDGKGQNEMGRKKPEPDDKPRMAMPTKSAAKVSPHKKREQRLSRIRL